MSPADRLQQIQQTERALAQKFPSSVSKTPQFKALVVEIVDLLQAIANAAKGFDGSRESAVALVAAGMAYVAGLDSIPRVGEEILRELAQRDGKPTVN